MNMLAGGLLGAGSVAICSAVLISNFKEQAVLKPIEELKVRITGSTTVPDPAKIQTTGDWYVLDHVSSGLTAFDSEAKKFRPLLAEEWVTTPDGVHKFKLRSGITFHDGTPITAKDVLWTIKRQLILKTSTHFPLWDYIVGCERLKSLNDECDGLYAVSDREIAIRLKMQTDSFFLQLASPETGIWAAADMDPVSAKLTPTKYSGPYFFAAHDDTQALLKRNERSLVSQEFPNSPRALRLKTTSLPNLDQALTNRDVDLAIRPYRPFGEREWEKDGIQVHSTTPSTMIYFYGTGTRERLPIGQDFIKAAWAMNHDPMITPADTYLPFAKDYGLSRGEFLSSLPEHTAPKLRILCPDGFFSNAFLNQLKAVARSVGTEIEFNPAPQAEWYKAFHDPAASEKYDYILSAYAASERYPAVQLRYITRDLVKPPIDLKKAESPELNSERIAILKEYQKWLLRSRQAIPFYLNGTLFLHQSNVDIGKQPSSDAEIELWRVQGKG